MGAKLEAYFDRVKEAAGATAQMKLAMLTRMSPKKAREAEDSDANIAVFELAMERLKEQGVL
jgi:hypothetical protein